MILGESVGIAWLDEDGKYHDTSLDFNVCATFLSIIDKYGIDHAFGVATAFLPVLPSDATDTDFDARSKQINSIVQSLRALDLHRGKLAEQEYEMLNLSYHALLNKEQTRAEVAEFASIMLGHSVSTDAWRKAVDRWAEREGLPPLGQTKRRPRKLSGQ